MSSTIGARPVRAAVRPPRLRPAARVQRSPACCRRPTCTSRDELGALVGEHDEQVLLATALAVRAPRLGHVLVDLAHDPRDRGGRRRRAGRPVESLPWPEPEQWVRAGRRLAAGQRGARRCRRAAAAAAADVAVPRPLLGRGGPGRGAPCRRSAEPAADGRPRAAARAGCGVCSAQTARTGRASPRPRP